MTEIAGMHPRKDYPPAMERSPRVYPERNPEAQAAALAAGTMFDCTRFPGAVRLSERQCLINQERAAAGGFPSYCVDCPEGREIKARHPEGPGVAVKSYALDGVENRSQKAAKTRWPGKGKGPAKKLIGRSVDPPPAVSVCAKHQVEMIEDKRGQDYCPKCRGEAHLGGIPICPVHKVKKTADKGGRYYCEKCRSSGQRNRQKKEKDMKEATLASSPQKVAEKEAPSCLKHPEEKQLLDDQDRPSGICRLCLPLQKVQAARPGVEAPPMANSNSGAGTAPRCPKHPDEPQHQTKKGNYMGRCLLCLQDVVRESARSRKNNNAARRMGVPALRQAAPPGEIRRTEVPLLAKFPDFDPSWPDDLKNKWFDIFKELIPLGSENGGQEDVLGKQASKQASKQGLSL